MLWDCERGRGPAPPATPGSGTLEEALATAILKTPGSFDCLKWKLGLMRLETLSPGGITLVSWSTGNLRCLKGSDITSGGVFCWLREFRLEFSKAIFKQDLRR